MAKRTPDIEPLLAELAELKLQEARITNAKTAVSKMIMDALQIAKIKSKSVDLGNGAVFRVTLTQGTTVSYDDVRLKKKLGPKLWKAVTKQVLDRKLLEEQVVNGAIKAVDVADCSTVTDNAPYLRTSGVYDETDIERYFNK